MTQPAIPPPPSDTALLLEYLKHYDAFCPVCNYNLRNLTQPRCPECGRGLMISVGATEPYLVNWILLTISLGFAAGLGLVAAPTMIQIPFAIFHHPFGYFWASYCLGSIPLCLLSVLFRRRFCRWPRTLQFTIAISAASAFGLILVGFALQWQH